MYLVGIKKILLSMREIFPVLNAYFYNIQLVLGITQRLQSTYIFTSTGGEVISYGVPNRTRPVHHSNTPSHPPVTHGQYFYAFNLYASVLVTMATFYTPSCISVRDTCVESDNWKTHRTESRA